MKKSSKIICSLLSAVMLSSAAALPTMAEDNIKVLINGYELHFDVPPQIMNGRTMVPLRAIFEALDTEVIWDDESHTIVSIKNGKEIELTIGSPVMYIDSRAVSLDAPACISDGRTLVPVRAVSEALGTQVDWDGETKTVSIKAAGVNFTGNDEYEDKKENESDTGEEDNKENESDTGEENNKENESDAGEDNSGDTEEEKVYTQEEKNAAFDKLKNIIVGAGKEDKNNELGDVIISDDDCDIFYDRKTQKIGLYKSDEDSLGYIKYTLYIEKDKKPHLVIKVKNKSSESTIEGDYDNELFVMEGKYSEDDKLMVELTKTWLEQAEAVLGKYTDDMTLREVGIPVGKKISVKNVNTDETDDDALVKLKKAIKSNGKYKDDVYVLESYGKDSSIVYQYDEKGNTVFILIEDLVGDKRISNVEITLKKNTNPELFISWEEDEELYTESGRYTKSGLEMDKADDGDDVRKMIKTYMKDVEETFKDYNLGIKLSDLGIIL